MNSERQKSVVNAAISDNQRLKGALLPILHQIQGDLGFIPGEQISVIASALKLSRAEVYGVVSFYHSFTTVPHGKHVIEVCRAESCQATGGRAIETALKSRLGIDYEQTTSDGEFTLQAVYCLGNCACSPSMKIDSQIHGRLCAETVITMIDNIQSGEQS